MDTFDRVVMILILVILTVFAVVYFTDSLFLKERRMKRDLKKCHEWTRLYLKILNSYQRNNSIPEDYLQRAMDEYEEMSIFANKYIDK